ncbi:MAG: hypothetical protein IJI65_01325 [Lachnospiraceae bacterium]|nr:hypothetical protein [Lachnospiraceae bacterium]
MNRKEKQRANRRAKAQAIEEMGLPEDTKYVDFKVGRKNMVGKKDLTAYFAIKYMDSNTPEADRIYLEGVQYGN